MHNHDSVRSYAHEIQHLAVIFQLAYGSIDHGGLVTPKLGKLARMNRQAMPVLVRQCPGLSEEVRAVLQSVAILAMRGKREHFRGKTHKPDILHREEGQKVVIGAPH